MAARLLNQPAQAQCDAYTPLGESIPGARSAPRRRCLRLPAARSSVFADSQPRLPRELRGAAIDPRRGLGSGSYNVGCYWPSWLHGACRTVAIGMFMGCSALDHCDGCVRCAGLLVTRPRIARVRATTALMSCLAMVLHVQSTVKAQSIVEALQRHSGGGRLART